MMFKTSTEIFLRRIASRYQRKLKFLIFLFFEKLLKLLAAIMKYIYSAACTTVNTEQYTDPFPNFMSV